jgi:hypothetical protein
MNKKMFGKSFLMLMMLLSIQFLNPIMAQTKEIEKQEKRQKKKKGGQEQAEKELYERHLSIQKKETRKRIKRSLKEAERRKKGKNPNPWYERMFRRGPKTKRAKTT